MGLRKNTVAGQIIIFSLCLRLLPGIICCDMFLIGSPGNIISFIS